MTELVTGDAVVVEVRRAELGSRAVARSLDAALQYLALLGVLLVIGTGMRDLDEALVGALGLTGWLVIALGYPVATETLTRGRTLGKMALGLRVVREDGGPIRFRHALLRGLLDVVEFWLTLGLLALLTALVSRQGRRLGDLVAGTVVVRERAPVQSAPPPAMPPRLAGWASGLDLSRLPDDLALAARQFLVRQQSLTTQAREGMARSLATAVSERVSPPPLPGISAAEYLAVVLAERRQRELSRLQRPGAVAAPQGAGAVAAPGHPGVRGPNGTGAAPPPPPPPKDAFAPPG